MNNDQSANKREKKREDDRKRNSAQHGRVNCNIYGWNKKEEVKENRKQKRSISWNKI